MPVNIPEIVILRNRVEEAFGKPLESHNAFISLVGAIESAVREHLSESTLERMWGYSTRETNAISLRTLNVLSRYVGSSSWKGFRAAWSERRTDLPSNHVQGFSVFRALKPTAK